MEKERGHAILLPYPSQGHINPMLQFAKRLTSNGVGSTLAVTRFILRSTRPDTGPISIRPISDGFDEGGFGQAASIGDYLARLEAAGSETLVGLIDSLQAAGWPVKVVVYDAFLPWALDVARQYGLKGAAFFTQAGAVNLAYYHAWQGRLSFPVEEAIGPLPGLPRLEPRDLPSLLSDPNPGPYPAYRALLLSQYRNLEKADVALINSFSELEREELEEMKAACPMTKPIGPTLPSSYLDKRIPSDTHYDFNLHTIDNDRCTEWLDSKPPASVVYVSFGSMASLSPEQTEELAYGLKNSGKDFLWVVRASERAKLPDNFVKESSERGLLVGWCPQLDVLAHRATGCFLTHCGWNSTMEALSLGVPMIGVPQWTDQPMNAKYVEDVWKVGVRVRLDDKGFFPREEVERCVKEVMEGERSEEIRKNAARWKELAREAVTEGGSSDKSILEFIDECCK